MVYLHRQNQTIMHKNSHYKGIKYSYANLSENSNEICDI